MFSIGRHSIKAIIFDHDGTLVDSEPMHLQAWGAVLEALGHHLTLTEYQQNLSGKPTLVTAQWLQKRFDLDIPHADLFQRKREILRAMLNNRAFPLMPGAINLLQQLQSAGVPLAVASGAIGDEVHHSLHYHALKPFFTGVATGSDVDRNKPFPDVYQLAAERLGVPAHQCCAVEDSDSGQQSALSAGMPCLRLETYTEMPSHPDCIRIAALPNVLDHLVI